MPANSFSILLLCTLAAFLFGLGQDAPNALALQQVPGEARTGVSFVKAQEDLESQGELEAMRMRLQFHETQIMALTKRLSKAETACCCRGRRCQR